jgi:hypothetical protein
VANLLVAQFKTKPLAIAQKRLFNTVVLKNVGTVIEGPEFFFVEMIVAKL